MKRTPRMERIEELMRSSKIVAGGFLGGDPRPLEEIIEADAAELEALGVDCRTLAARMADLRDQARRGLGDFVPVGAGLEAAANDSRGTLICPWGDNTRHFKTLITVRRKGTDRTFRWSDLTIHLIGEHGFFQGRHSAFRLEPRELVELLFDRGGGAPAKGT